jgi:FkbM family methyltransferase
MFESLFRRDKNKSKRTDRLTYHITPTGNYYLPTDARGDIIANAIIAGKIFDHEVVDVAMSYIKPGTAVLDVGANFGQMSILFSNMVGSIGKVYSFEAEPYVFEILKKNIMANDKTNITTIGKAVYNSVGEKVIFPEPDFKRFDTYGSYGIDPRANKGRYVETITIDSLIIKEPISFMNIDIQGSDLFAMQGAVETIERNRMPILFEFEAQFQKEFSTSFNEYMQFVKDINYKVSRIINDINYLILPKEM